MAGTLAEQLDNQNRTLGQLSNSVDRLNGNLSDLVRMQVAEYARQREARNDARLAGNSAGGVGGAGGGGGNAASGDGGGFFNRFGFGVGLGAGGAAGVLTRIAKRGLLAGAINAAAQVTGDFIQDQTGSVELGDATQRAMTLGSFGLLFGKKIGAIAAFVGAVATDENKEKLAQLGDSISTAGKSVSDWFAGLGFSLPTMTEMLNKVTEMTGDLIDVPKNLLEGNIAQAATDSSGLATALGIAYGTKKGAQKGDALKNKIKGVPNNVDMEFTKQQRLDFNRETVRGLGKKKVAKLRAQGFRVDNVTGELSRNGKIMSADAMDDALKGVGAKGSMESKGAKQAVAAVLNERAAQKYGRFAKFLKVGRKLPVVGSLISFGSFAGILANDKLSDEEKAAELAKLLGGIGGGTLGALVGGTLGSVVPGVGNVVGGLVGGIGGAVAGEKMIGMLTEWLLEKGDGQGMMAGVKNVASQNIGSAVGAVASSMPVAGQAMAAMSATGSMISSGYQQMFGGPGGQPMVIMDNSVSAPTISSGGGGTILGTTQYYDNYDPLQGTRR